MESKTVILSVLFVMSLIMAQTQVDAMSCCRDATSRTLYDTCRFTTTSAATCASIFGCLIVDNTCPPDYPYWGYDLLENSAGAINEYCNLGCVSSACGALTTLRNSDPNAIVNGAFEQCAKACSTFCTKGSMTAVEAA
ncbi:putative thionin-2.4 [Raphanus sativus]|uniref:Probable thionin-2.4 n=1 Tax=Raphanus sativus TaxID=3726 RepID=A0A9W3CKQ7_RAPSA|nr:probable thionin-2.4 [Raphanus sativus]KAJ4873323.1 putative thionin-2.4 [Raphanus sativus]